MSEEIEPQHLDDDFFKVIAGGDDLLAFLLAQSDSFKFSTVKFKADVDLYEIISANPVPGITLLERKERGPKPDILKELNPTFDCSDIQFDKPVLFVSCEFTMHVDFQNVNFRQGVSFRFSKFHKGLSLIRIKAEGTSTFGLISNQSVMVLNSSFNVLDNLYTKVDVEGNFHIENTSFNSGLNLSGCKVTDQLNLISIKLNGILDLSQSSLGTLNLGSIREPRVCCEVQDLNISRTEFQGQVQFSDLNINGTVSGQGAVFKESIFFTNVNFNQHAYLTHTTINKSIYLENVCAKGNFSFYGATFNAGVHFNEIDFSTANVSFTGSHINADLWIGSLLHKDAKVYSGTLNFHGAMISQTSIVRIFNLNNVMSPAGEIDFSNALIKGLLDIRNVYVNKITFNGTVVTGNIQDNNSLQSAIADRNTARLLKHEARRINNTISALNYNKIEMKLYAKTVKVRQFADWSMLKLNRISNNYGSDWVWGMGFTMACGLICYSIFNISIYGFGFFWADSWNFIYNDARFWSGFINYFWLPTGFNELARHGVVQGGIAGGIVFILGKILIAYGIYQTVSAFRKYI